MDLRTFLNKSPDLSERACAEGFAARWTTRRFDKGAHLARQDLLQTDEFILLDGHVTSSICDPEGEEVCSW